VGEPLSRFLVVSSKKKYLARRGMGVLAAMEAEWRDWLVTCMNE
jgi:hypothetical protein